MSKKKKAGIVVLVILLILAAAAGTIYFLGHRYYSKTNFLSDEEAVEQIEKQKAERKAAQEKTATEEEAERKKSIRNCWKRRRIWQSTHHQNRLPQMAMSTILCW